MKNDTLAFFFFVNSPTYNFLHIRSATFEVLCAYRETDGQADFYKRFAETRRLLKIRMSRLPIAVTLPAPQKLSKLSRPHRYCYCGPHLTEPSQINISKLGGDRDPTVCIPRHSRSSACVTSVYWLRWIRQFVNLLKTSGSTLRTTKFNIKKF
jgi:hypothetical protein